MAVNKQLRRQKIKYRIRRKIKGLAERPRLSVFRSNRYIYAQLIDDLSQHTLAAASSREANVGGDDATKKDSSRAVGKLLAERALAAGITHVVFDRGGYLYHGRVQALAEGAREGGLQF